MQNRKQGITHFTPISVVGFPMKHDMVRLMDPTLLTYKLYDLKQTITHHLGYQVCIPICIFCLTIIYVYYYLLKGLKQFVYGS